MSLNITGRPMIMIRRDLMDKLHKLSQEGVPYTVLVKKHDLPMAALTLQRKLDWYKEALEATEEVRAVMFASLFPEWLIEEVQTQSHVDYMYEGTMPMGKWLPSREAIKALKGIK